MGLAGFAKVNVNVNEAGGDDQAASVDDLIALFRKLTGLGDFLDASVAEEQVTVGVNAVSWIDQSPTFYMDGLGAQTLPSCFSFFRTFRIKTLRRRYRFYFCNQQLTDKFLKTFQLSGPRYAREAVLAL